MTVLLKGGTVVNADQSLRADVLCDEGKIVAVGANLDTPGGAVVIDADGLYVMPGGIDPHTHMSCRSWAPSRAKISSPARPRASRAARR